MNTLISPFPYHGSYSVAAPTAPAATSTVGIWFAYFESTLLANDGQAKVITLSGMGTSGNGALFESLSDGVKMLSTCIVQATAWGLVENAVSEVKWLGIQLDQQGSLAVRAHTVFNQHAANITYGGALATDDILRIVGSNSGAAEDSVLEGWVSLIATPIS